MDTEYLRLGVFAFRAHHVRRFREIEKQRQERLEEWWKRARASPPATDRQIAALHRHNIPVPIACTQMIVDALVTYKILGMTDRMRELQELNRTLATK